MNGFPMLAALVVGLISLLLFILYLVAAIKIVRSNKI